MKKNPLDEAMRLLERAGDSRSRLRALESVRASLALELKDHARSRTALKSPTDSQVAKLERNLADAWAEFEAVSGGGLETALRALQGVREAVHQLRAAEARIARVGKGGTVTMVVKGYGGKGKEITHGEVPREQAFQGVPEEFHTGHRVVRQLQWSGESDIRVYDKKTGKLVWRRPGTPQPKPPPRRALPHEEPSPPNGNGASPE
jgi:hypothetical protein